MRLNRFVIIETKAIEYFTNFRFDFDTQLYTQWLGTDEKDTKKLWQSISYVKTYTQKVLESVSSTFCVLICVMRYYSTIRVKF